MRVLVDWDIPPVEQTVIDAWPAGIEVIEGGSKLTVEEKLKLAPSIDVQTGLMRVINRPFIDAATRLKLVHMTGHGVDLLMRNGIPDLMQQRGIRIATAHAGDIPIAEYAIMAMVMLSRQVLRSHAALTSRGKWESQRGPELFGSTLCIVGFGSIGKATAVRARAFGMQVGMVTLHPERHEDHDLAFAHTYADIDKALAVSDYVLVTAPLTSITNGLMDAGRFAAMKPGSYLVCITRGPLIVERALYEALQSGHLAGAAMDGWWREEEDGTGRDGYPADLPLHQFNMLMTPHNSGTTFGTRQRAIRLIGDNIGRLMRGEPLINEVAPHDLKKMAV
ncbi:MULTISPECIES: 2-hydroxyacid dehydrogenase [Chelativorans]|jgi:phosphoglycerate dehydrogenase-like enzyme|uniref:D-isomer specific 2-hydroxyacid dehydrogenase, NAD-binding protein n=1 Tax=Chelativorans sp. (strain BNC1) TaxID=266779 RepID=Q11GX7_CHESB|nr:MULTISPECIES: 2-hydroxyacid dehydrogenase [Chelativorans]